MTRKCDVIAAAAPYAIKVAFWVRSLNLPGGNLTGLFLDLPELGGKQIQLLKEAGPRLSRVAVLVVQSLAIQRPRDFQDVFDRAARETAQGVIVLSSPLINEQRSHIAALAMKRRLPTISLFTSFPDSGTLMAYGPNLQELYKRAPSYVDKILKGARPGELPIERPTRFEFVINLKTAKALGLTIPHSLVLRADRVIE